MSLAQCEFKPFEARMAAAGLPDVAIRAFQNSYDQFCQAEQGFLREPDIQPVTELPSYDELHGSLQEDGHRALSQVVAIKLNGGLGTSMGLQGPKSLIEVRDGCSFLEIIARQSDLDDIPLLLMNSFATREATLTELDRLQELARPSAGHAPSALPPDFLQHRVPKVDRRTLGPVAWPPSPDLTWCPPGHGDLYTALLSSGLLDRLIAGGVRTAFVSNADNLGAVMDERLLGYFVTHGLSFLMEVARREPTDRKGGHLARRTDGRLCLREVAQCAPEDQDAFQDIDRHRFFNTNSIWIDLPSLQELLIERNGVMGLPVIVNPKTVDPRDPDSPPVYQLETAMGAALESFPAAGALAVPRSRFAPVKTTDQLLALRSDAYRMTEAFHVVPHPEREPDLGPPRVSLDPDHYRLVDDLDRRFPHGPPSLLRCRSLEIRGDVHFGRDVTCVGDVEIVNESSEPRAIPDGATLEGNA